MVIQADASVQPLSYELLVTNILTQAQCGTRDPLISCSDFKQVLSWCMWDFLLCELRYGLVDAFKTSTAVPFDQIQVHFFSGSPLQFITFARGLDVDLKKESQDLIRSYYIASRTSRCFMDSSFLMPRTSIKTM